MNPFNENGHDSMGLPLRGPTVWVGLDDFGAEIAGTYLQEALNRSSERRKTNRVLPGPQNLDDVLRLRILHEVDQLLQELEKTMRSEVVDPSVDRDVRLLRRESRKFAVVHLWLIFRLDQDSKSADAVAEWLAKALPFFDGVPIKVRVHLLTACSTWNRTEDQRRVVTTRLLHLQQRVLAPGRAGHSRVVVLVATNRNYLAYKLSDEALKAAVGRFAAVILLTDAPRSRSQTVSRLFLPPTMGPPLARLAEGPRPVPTSTKPSSLPPRTISVRPAAGWGPFASFSVTVLAYPVKHRWEDRKRSRHTALLDVLNAAPPDQWSPEVPDLPDAWLIVASALKDFRRPDIPQWHPLLANPVDKEYAAVERGMNSWLRQATTWELDERKRFESRWRQIVNARREYVMSYEENFRRYQDTLFTAPHEGLFGLLDVYLKNCRGLVNQAIETKRTENPSLKEPDADDGIPAADAAPPDPPSIAPPKSILNPPGRRWRSARSPLAVMAEELATRVNVGQLLLVSFLSAVISIVLFYRTAHHISASLVGAYDRYAAGSGRLPRLHAAWVRDGLAVDSRFIFITVFALVALWCIFSAWRTRDLARRRLSRVYEEQFYEPATKWTEETMIGAYQQELQKYYADHEWAGLHDIRRFLDAQQDWLQQLRAQGAELDANVISPTSVGDVSKWKPADDLTVELRPANDRPPALKPGAAQAIVRDFRRFTVEGAAWASHIRAGQRVDNPDPANFYEALHRFAANWLRDSPSDLRRDVCRLWDQVEDVIDTLPAPEDILALPTTGRPRIPPWSVIQALAVPDYLSAFPLLRAAECEVLFMPIDRSDSMPEVEEVYAVAIRQGLTANDLFAHGGIAVEQDTDKNVPNPRAASPGRRFFDLVRSRTTAGTR